MEISVYSKWCVVIVCDESYHYLASRYISIFIHLSEYQHERVQIVFQNVFFPVLRTKLASASEGFDVTL